VERGAALFPGAQVDLATRLASRLDSQLGGVMTPLDRPADFLVAIIRAHTDAGLGTVPGNSVTEVSSTADRLEGAAEEAASIQPDPEGFAPPT